jgi:two-component system, chemotaxis family, protein-glutamate methylesterase/glutaminase
MSNRDIVAIGTSAGGVEALLYLAERLPASFPACILVTLHLSGQRKSILDELVSRAGPLPAKFASDGEPLRKGEIFIAPPNRHLLVEQDRLLLGTGAREHNARPAIDPMLRSTAVCCGPRAVGVVLTGTLGDGASGLWAISRCGGVSVVQHPGDAAFPEMPENALRIIDPDHVVRLRDMADLINSLVHQPVGDKVKVPEEIRLEVEMARSRHTEMEEMDSIGRRSFLACPDCHGVMWEIDENGLTRYRCHVGHTYTAELMDIAVDENLRRAMSSALRALEEKVFLARKLQRQAAERGHHLVQNNWAERVREYEQELKIVREAIGRMGGIAAKAAE